MFHSVETAMEVFVRRLRRLRGDSAHPKERHISNTKQDMAECDEGIRGEAKGSSTLAAHQSQFSQGCPSTPHPKDSGQ